MQHFSLKSIILLTCFSLLANMLNAQVLIVPRSGDPIYGYNVSTSGDYYFYQKSEKDESFLRIKKEDVLMLRDNDGKVIDLNTTVDSSQNVEASDDKKVAVDRFPAIPLSETHNNPLAGGNCIYIPTDSAHEYERVGQLTLKKVLEEGYNKVFAENNIKPFIIVDKPEQAHFVLQYFMNTVTGRDFACLFLRPREYYEQRPNIGNLWDEKNVGYCIVSVDAISGRGSLKHPEMENSRVNVELSLYASGRFVDLIIHPNNWKSFWNSYKKDGLFQKPHLKGTETLILEGIENDTKYDSFIESLLGN